MALDRPDLKGRELILRVHAKPVTLSSAVDLSAIAARTPGFVGADPAWEHELCGWRWVTWGPRRMVTKRRWNTTQTAARISVFTYICQQSHRRRPVARRNASTRRQSST